MLDQLPILSSLSPNIRELVLRSLVLIIALVVIFFARRLLMLVIMKPLRRLTERTGNNTPERLFDIVMGPVRLVVIAVGLTITAQLLIPNDTFFRGFISMASRTLIIVAVLMLLYRLIDLIVPSSAHLATLTGIRIEERLIPFLRVGVKLIVLAIGVVIITQELGYDVSGFIAGLGVGGLAISLAAQDTIANLFGFASIVGDSPFSVGDSIKTPDAEGVVEHVGVRSTRLRQADQTLVTLPNNKLANSAISNLSRQRKRRIDILLRLSLGTSSTQMRELLSRLRKLLADWPAIEPKSQQVFFSKFSDTALEVIVRCYINKPTWAEMMVEQENIQLRAMEIIETLGMRLAGPTSPVVLQQTAHED